MALTLGTNVGFVTTAPTADPAGGDTTIDGSSVVVKDTSPAGAVKITEIGWYRGSGTNTANFEVALYADSSGAAGARLYVDATNSSSSAGWITTAVDWAITPNTAYWLAVQMDAHTGTSTIDNASSGGSGSDVRTSQSSLADPYGGGAVADADGMYAIYALYQSAPTVALNSPDDAGSTSDTTPDLVFTGTDADGDAIRYKIQVDTSSNFDSQSTPATAGITSETSTYADSVADSGAFTKITLASASFIQKLTKRTRSSSGTVHAKALIYADSAGSPTTRLAVGTETSITTTLQGWDLEFSSPISLAAGTYWIGSVTDGIMRNYYDEATGNYVDSPASFSYSSPPDPFGSVGGSGAGGYCVYATYTVEDPLIDAVSGTDAGFSNIDTDPTDHTSDTDPFYSGDQIQYTVQSALSPGTYYWRVRGIDPSGSNTYGAWSSTRSLTVSSSSDVTINAGVQTSTSSIQTSIRKVLKEPSVLSATTQLQTPTLVIKKLPSVLTSSASIQSPTVTSEQNVTIEPSVLVSTVGMQTPTLVGRVNPATLGSSSGVQAPTPVLAIGPGVFSLQGSVQSPTVYTEQNITINPSVLATSVSLLDGEKVVSQAIPILETTSSVQAVEKVISLALPTVGATTEIQASEKVVSLAPATLASTSSVQTSEKTITKAPTTFSIASSLTAPELSALKQISELLATSSVLDPVVTVNSGTTFSASVLSASTSIQTASREVKKTASVLSLTGSLPTGRRSISKQASVISSISALQTISLAIQQNRTANPQVLAVISSLIAPVISLSAGGSLLTDNPFYDGSLTEDPAALKSLADPTFYNSSMTEEAAESNSLTDTVFYDEPIP